MTDTFYAAIAGGVSAIFGSLITQAFVAHAALARERKAVLRDKGEVVVMALTRHEAWFIEHNGSKHVDHLMQASTAYLEARAIQRLYFPGQTQSIERVGFALQRYRTFIWDCQERGGLDADQIADVDENGQLFHAHQEAVQECIDVICAAVQVQLATTQREQQS